jgi:hypothetical protein
VPAPCLHAPFEIKLSHPQNPTCNYNALENTPDSFKDVKMLKKILDTTISINQMEEAIKKSGYLLEYRVASILSKERYFVEANPVFPDPETKKSREFDISAISATRLYKKGWNFVFPVLLCECENNLQPVAFFTKESPISFLHHQEVKVSGIPVKFWQKDGYISFSDFVGMGKFHHYCKGATATQYCTFQLKKDQSSWIALHNEEQHDTFNKLINVLEFEIANHFDGWVLPKDLSHEDINIQIYYPLLILQGQLYSAIVKGRNTILRKSNHIQFRKEFFSTRTNEVETYQIDIITEGYLRSYLKMIESEINKIKNALQRKRNKVSISIKKIVAEAKNCKSRIKSYRKFLEE